MKDCLLKIVDRNRRYSPNRCDGESGREGQKTDSRSSKD